MLFASAYPPVIGFLGTKGSGKDALSYAMRVATTDHGPMTHISFARILKLCAREIYGLTAEQVEDPVLKETPIACLATPEYPDGLTPRVILQRLGTEVGRSIAEDTWVWAWRRSVADFQHGNPRSVVFTSDVRFPNEAAAVRQMGGALIRVIRPAPSPTLFSNHASETSAAHIPADVEVLNDGSLDQLKQAASVVANTLGAKMGTGARFRCAIGAWSTP